ASAVVAGAAGVAKGSFAGSGDAIEVGVVVTGLALVAAWAPGGNSISSSGVSYSGSVSDCTGVAAAACSGSRLVVCSASLPIVALMACLISLLRKGARLVFPAPLRSVICMLVTASVGVASIGKWRS